jgi:CBS domain containing-hemolysin-like protein
MIPKRKDPEKGTWANLSRRARRLSPARRSATRAGDVMLPLDQVERVNPNAELWTAQKLDRNGVNQLSVVRDDRVIGMLAREDVISFLRKLEELGTGSRALKPS